MPDETNSAQAAEEPQDATVEAAVKTIDTDTAPEVPEWVRDPVAAYAALQAARKEAAENRAKLKAEQEQAAKEAEERRQAKLTAIEKAEDKARKAEEKVKEYEQRAVNAERRALLTGRVVDLDAALELIKPEHLDANGNLDVEAFLDARAFLKVPETKDEPTTRLAGGNSRSVAPSDKSQFNDFLRRAARR